MKYPVPPPLKKSLGRLLLGLAITASFTGCAIPARISYDAKLAELCAKPGLYTVYSRAQLQPNDFDPQGAYLVQRENGRTLIANRFWRDTSETVLQSDSIANVSLVQRTTVVSERVSGKTLGAKTTYCRRGGDSFSLNNTVECCPVTPETDLNKNIFNRNSP